MAKGPKLKWLAVLSLSALWLNCSDGGSGETNHDLSGAEDIAGRDGLVDDMAEGLLVDVSVNDATGFELLDDSAELVPKDLFQDTRDWFSGPDADVSGLELPQDFVSDSGELDVTVPLEGFGSVSGSCGVLEESHLLLPESWFFTNHLDFGEDPYDEGDCEELSPGGQEIINDDNAGGSSIYSEVFAFEVLHRCELANLLKTELEIIYDPPEGKLTDLLVLIDGHKVGVSVTRAVGYPKDAPYTVEQAGELLDKKLSGVLESSGHVASEDAWVKQILYILAFSQEHADAVEQAYLEMDEAVIGDTLVVVTVTDGEDINLY